MRWAVTSYGDPRCQLLISRHYNRWSKRARRYSRVGYSLVLYAADSTGEAVFVWWRPKWESGLVQAQRHDGLHAIECVIFRNESKVQSSTLIRAAVAEVLAWSHAKDVEWPDGLLTSVNSAATAARRGKRNPPGQCYLAAGWAVIAGKRTKNADVWLKWQGAQEQEQEQDECVKKWLLDRCQLGFSRRGISPAQIAKFVQTRAQRFGKLTATAYVRLHPRKDGTGASPVWQCRCDCGEVAEVRQDFLRIGDAISCGRCRLNVELPQLPEAVLRETALAIELEGSLGVYATPMIALSTRDYSRELVEGLAAKVGMGTIHGVIHEGRPQVRWQVSGHEAVELARQLVPFMLCKRSQAEAMAAFPLGARNRRVSPEDSHTRTRLAELTKHLNRKGPRESSPEWARYGAEWKNAVRWMSREARLALLALAVELEGTLGVYRHKSLASRGGSRFSVLLGVYQTASRGVILEVTQELARGVGRLSSPQVPRNPKHAPMMSWVVDRADEVVPLVVDLLPFLTSKRERAAQVVAFPGAAWEKRCQLAAECRRLVATRRVL